MMKIIKKRNGYGAFEYAVVTAFILLIAIILLTDTRGAITDSSSVIRTSFLQMFGVSAE